MPATPGRPETPNRREARSILKERFPDWHPFVQICETAQGLKDGEEDPETTPERRDQAASNVLGYLMPKLKAVEHTGADGGPFVIMQSAGDDEL